MTVYFPEHLSAAAVFGSRQPEAVLSLIANRYIGDNPPLPYVYRTYNRGAFRQHPDGRYDINLAERLPDSKQGQFAYAFGLVWCDTARGMELSLSCYGPTTLWVNGVMAYKSAIVEEVNHNVAKPIVIELKEGWNECFLRLRRTPSGFGCVLGSARSKWAPLDVLSPFREREGQAGWIYSEATWTDIVEEGRLPDRNESEADSRLRWYPQTAAYHEEGEYVLSWSMLHQPLKGKRNVQIEGSSAGEIQLFMDNRLIWEGKGGAVQLETELACGDHTVVVIASGRFQLNGFAGGAALSWRIPYPVQGYRGAWLCLGGFRRPPVYIAQQSPSILKVYGDKGGERYWRAGETDNWIRPYVETPVYGRWNYPAGVTLYGLLQAGRTLGRADWSEYAASHIRLCVDAWHYASWSAERNGYPSVNHQLVELNMLDDCGSIGSAMLEAEQEIGRTETARLADRIASYMMSGQERKEDGAFYRKQTGYFMENTLWADDLYMSVPFLIRYARRCGRNDCLEEAVRQMRLYRGYLYMPQSGLMSHVYDFKYGTATGVPWGRGNGWALFSLAELLTMLATDHADYAEIVSFYRELCSGVLHVQGDAGMWHQVLTDPESYEETSCTAMFVYAFARGVRLGLFDDAAKYELAAERGWQALARRSIDREGHVHGVCQGSRYAFTPDYYKYELSWRTDDTHGIGIVLLAGVEVAKLHLYKKSVQDGERRERHA